MAAFVYITWIISLVFIQRHQCANILNLNSNNNDVTIQATPTDVYEGVPTPVILNCTFHYHHASQFGTLLSLIISKATDQGVYIELCSMSSFSRHHVTSNSSLPGAGTGYLAPDSDSFLQWTLPANTEVEGEYMCQAFGMDLSGHPKTVDDAVDVIPRSLDLDQAVQHIKELNQQQQACQEFKNNNSAVLEENRLLKEYASNISQIIKSDANTSRDDDLKFLTSQMTILDKFRAVAFDNISTTYQGHKYYLSHYVYNNGGYTVLAAQEECKRWEGYLVEVNTQGEWDFIVGFLNDSNTDPHMIRLLMGATDEGHEAHWTYLTSGQPLEFFDWEGDDSTHRNDRNRNCIVFEGWKTETPFMRDWSCDRNQWQGYVCEVEMD